MESVIQVDILVKFLLAILFGSTVGLERYIHGRPAGVRTYILVCVAFASIAVLSEHYYLGNGVASSSGFRPDPGRIMAGGLTGIGFLGAGIIIRSGVSVYGLTTAAGIWAISVVGLALGMGNYYLATALYVVTIFALMVLRHVESHLKTDTYKTLEISFRSPGFSIEAFQLRLKERNLKLLSTDVLENRLEHVVTCRMMLKGTTETSFQELYRDAASLDGIIALNLVGQTNTQS